MGERDGVLLVAGAKNKTGCNCCDGCNDRSFDLPDGVTLTDGFTAQWEEGQCVIFPVESPHHYTSLFVRNSPSGSDNDFPPPGSKLIITMIDRDETVDPLNATPVFTIEVERVDDFNATLTFDGVAYSCLLYTSPSPRDQRGSRMPSSA